MQISGKLFVVTGAGNGMGQQVAMQLAQRGADVAAVDVDEAGLERTADAIAAIARRASTHRVDVTEADAVHDLHQQILQTHQRIDGLVNIAGVIHRFTPFTDLSAAEITRVMSVNFLGTVHMCRQFLPTLQSRPIANLTNMSSLSALLPFASQTIYSASKGAVQQLSEGLYAELYNTNVRVVTVFPGNISTNLTSNSGVTMLDPGGKKVRSTTPAAAGVKIVEAIEKDRFRAVIGTDARILSALSRLSAKRTTQLVAKQIKSVL